MTTIISAATMLCTGCHMLNIIMYMHVLPELSFVYIPCNIIMSMMRS